MFYDYRIEFKNGKEALKYLRHLFNVAVANHHVLVSDVYDELGITVHDGDKMRGWTPTLVKAGNVVKKNGKWTIEFPDTMHVTELEKHFYKISKPAPQTDPQPIYITIHTNEVSDLNTTITDIFKHIQTIKDRIVNLTIM